ncbi:MAG TPA: EamA family transporter RarD [Anaerolineales bacterium]|nr:EamA family transporter RarD [Anaerolineales bacterium]
MNKGIWYAVGAYFLWGILPVYWKMLHTVSAAQVIGHRIGWSFIFLVLILLVTGRMRNFRTTAMTRANFKIYAVAGVLVTINWLIYVWAVNADHIIETSLGYFINPLVSVLLGVIFLRERLRPLQWLPIGLATAGVVYLTFEYGRLPWIAIALALSFGLYGLVKKTAPLSSLYGMTMETGIVFLPALAYLSYAEFTGQGAFGHSGSTINLFLAGTGIVTAVPLLMFASAAQRIPLTLVGVLQYIAPTLQFLIGVLIYQEPFSHTQLIGFGIVWAALIIFWVEGWMARRASVVIAPAD